MSRAPCARRPCWSWPERPVDDLATDDPTELYRYTSLDSFLAIFWMVQELIIGPADWERVAYESLLDASDHGLRYREMFFTPARHLAAGQRWPTSSMA